MTRHIILLSTQARSKDSQLHMHANTAYDLAFDIGKVAMYYELNRTKTPQNCSR